MEASNEELAAFFGESFATVAAYAELLRAHGDELGLLGPRELDRLWSRHIVNSAAAAEFVPSASTVIDVGSGAGLPGIVLAAMRPDLRVELVEPMERRVKWLSFCCGELGLGNVSVTRARAEELAGQRAVDAVTCRAVSALRNLAGLVAPLLRSGGVLVALKGAKAGEELAAAAGQLKKAHLGSVEIIETTPMTGSEPTHVVRAVKW